MTKEETICRLERKLTEALQVCYRKNPLTKDIVQAIVEDHMLLCEVEVRAVEGYLTRYIVLVTPPDLGVQIHGDIVRDPFEELARV